MVAEGFEWPEPREGGMSFVHAAGIIVAAYVLGIVLASLGYLGINVLTGLTDETAPVLFNLWLTVLQFVGFILAAVWYVANVDRDILHVERPNLGTVGWIVGGFVLLMVVNVVMSVFISLLGTEAAQNQVIETGRETPVFLLYMIPIALLLVGPGEELLFRGVVQGKLREAFGVWPGIVLASVVFGLVHWLALVGTGSGRLVYVAVAAALGLALGTVYEYSKNILVPIVIHGCWNAMLFAINWYVIVNDIQLPS